MKSRVKTVSVETLLRIIVEWHEAGGVWTEQWSEKWGRTKSLKDWIHIARKKLNRRRKVNRK
jgi:hypothetical protein